MLGYWNDAEKTAEAVDGEGWMHTGDLATIDAEGYCNIVGRIKDMVIRGGENIYPREIEEFLFRHPKIEDVQVVGLSILSGSHGVLVADVLRGLEKEGLAIPVVVGGIIPEEDARALRESGVRRIYTPKDFDLTRIMDEIVDVVAEAHAVR